MQEDGKLIGREQRRNGGCRRSHGIKGIRMKGAEVSRKNVSNTIHGVYITFDATDLLPGVEDVPPAYDLFGTMPIEREWVSVNDLKVTEVDDDGQTMIGECDTKDQFISGFIVRQLIRDGVIAINVE